MTAIVPPEFVSRVLATSEGAVSARRGENSSQEPDAQAAAILDRLTTGLRKLRLATGFSSSGVLVSTEDKYVSLFQSFLAEKSSERQRLEPSPTGGLEAKYDPSDWLGWFSSFLGWWKLRGKAPHQWSTAPLEPDRFPGNNPNKARV